MRFNTVSYWEIVVIFPNGIGTLFQHHIKSKSVLFGAIILRNSTLTQNHMFLIIDFDTNEKVEWS